MRHQPIPASLYSNNRSRLASLLAPGSVAVLHSNDVMPTNADGTMRFRQNSDLLYLCGIQQEETMLLLYPDSPDPALRTVLFISEPNEHKTKWDGHMLSRSEASLRSGIAEVRYTHDFDQVLLTCLSTAEHIYLNSNEHTRASSPVLSRDQRFVAQCQARYPLHSYRRLAPLLHQLRAMKSAEEIALMQQAIAITHQGLLRVCSQLKPGTMEYEVEADFIYEFTRRGADGFAYSPIVAGGANACILHYIENSRALQAGTCVLLDVGASYANYNADMTRVLPVSGRFSPRQRQVYAAVLRVKEQAASLLKPGYNLVDYTQAVACMVEKELVDLGLISMADIHQQTPQQPAYRRYYYHNPSHYLGLDVHDVGFRHATFQPGMVFTVEPGIYIAEEELGIRLEDNYLITEGEPDNLMSIIPIEPEAIENLMNP